MGHRAMVVAELFFEEVELTKENLIGEEGQGFKLAMMALDQRTGKHYRNLYRDRSESP